MTTDGEPSIPLRLYQTFLMDTSFGISVAQTSLMRGYIPLCVADENCNVDLSTLKALKVASEEFALTVLKEAGKHHITRRGYFKMAVEAGVITRRCSNCIFGNEPGYCELRRATINGIDNCNSHEFK